MCFPAKAGIERVSYQLVPSSPMGKAIRCFHDQWPKIEEIFRDGRYERTTTYLIENKIRLAVCSSGLLSKNNRITDNLL